MSNRVYVCRPCAEDLKAKGRLIIGSSVKDKQTCSVCDRRRFVYNCELFGSDGYVILCKTSDGAEFYIADGYCLVQGAKHKNTTQNLSEAKIYKISAAANSAIARMSNTYVNLSTVCTWEVISNI